MALEDGGISINVEKLKVKLKEKYPNYNFDIPPEPDRLHKAPHLCKTNTIFYTDKEGNRYCGTRYKEVDNKNIHKWEYKVCHALVEQTNQGGNQDVIPF
jgi:hypothetical protein